MVGDGGAPAPMAAPKAKKSGPQQSSIAQMFKRAAAASSCRAEAQGAPSKPQAEMATAQPSAQDDTGHNGAGHIGTGPLAEPSSIAAGKTSGEPAQKQEGEACPEPCVVASAATKGNLQDAPISAAEGSSRDGQQTHQPVQRVVSSQACREDSISRPICDHGSATAHPLQGISVGADVPGHSSMEHPPNACNAADCSEQAAPTGLIPAAEPKNESIIRECHHTSEQTEHRAGNAGSTRPSDGPNKSTPCQQSHGDESVLGGAAGVQPECDLTRVDIEEQKRIMHEIWMRSRGNVSRTGEDDVRDATSAAADRSAKRGRVVPGTAAGSAMREGAGKQMRISAMFKTPRKT